MRFEPKTEKEIAEAGLLPPGTYDFEITAAEERLSKAGNDMIVLDLKVFDADGGYRLVRDYLLESMPHKLRHIAYACGLGDRYELGSLDALDLVDKVGQVKLGIKKDKDGQYPDQNSVRDYVVPEAGGPSSKSEARQPVDLDDEIPF